MYAPKPKQQTIDDLDFELPPEWAANPTHTSAALEVRDLPCVSRIHDHPWPSPTFDGLQLQVAKGAESVETLPVGEHDMYTFGRSLTCDLPHAIPRFVPSSPTTLPPSCTIFQVRLPARARLDLAQPRRARPS